ncbi:MAG: dockerin type I domain-containing protein [Bacteroidota bacterium]
MKKAFLFLSYVLILSGQIIHAQAMVDVAIINPDYYRIIKFGYLIGECSDSKYYSIASGQIGDANPLDSNSWYGLGEHPDFLGSLLTNAGYIVQYFDQNSFVSSDVSHFEIVIVQDYLDSNLREFDKAVETNPPDLLEKVTSETFNNKLRSYSEIGGKIILVGDAVKLLGSAPSAGKFTLDYGKTIYVDEASSTLSQESSCVPAKWLFIRGNPFCGVNRNGSGTFAIESSLFSTNGTLIANLNFFDGNDIPHAMTWSNTIYYPDDGVSLLDVRVNGSGDFVLSGSTCNPPVYTVNVNDVLSNLLGYTDNKGRKIFYLGSDSYFDYDFINHQGAWHAGDSLEMKHTITTEGKNILTDFTKYIAAAPTDLTVIDSLNGSVTLEWQPSLLADYKKYRIYYDTKQRPNQLKDSTDNFTDTTITIFGLENNMRYYFQITAVDETGNESAFSNEVSVLIHEDGWLEDFESYSVSTFPSTWIPDGNGPNISSNYVDNSVSSSGSNSLRLFGEINSCWGALAYRELNAKPPFYVEVKIRNGDESLGGCHPMRGGLSLRHGTSWTNPSRRFILFDDGIIYGGDDSMALGSFQTLTWYTIKVLYEQPSPNNIRLSYWVDDVFKGSQNYEAFDVESQLLNLELVVQEGTAWFDDVKVEPISEIGGVSSIQINVPEISANRGDTVTVPINVTFPNNKIYDSAELSFGSYFDGLEFIEVDTTSTLIGNAGWTYTLNETNYLLLSAFSGADEISGSGVFCELKFVVTGLPCDFVPLTIESALFNTGEDSVTVTNGGIQIEPILVYGDVDGNGKIQAHDASLILKHIVGYETLLCQSLANADVTLDGSVSALDVSIIHQYLVHLIDILPHDSTMGNLKASGEISMENQVINSSSILEVPLFLSNGDNILSFDGKVLFDPKILNYQDIIWSDLQKNFSIEVNSKNGEIYFAGANSVPDGQTGVFAILIFEVSDVIEGNTEIVLERIRFNEGTVLTNSADASIVVGLNSDSENLPMEYSINQNYPNPFNPSTTLYYQLPEISSVRLTVFDILGNAIITLVNEEQPTGIYQKTFHANNLSSGIYFYVLSAQSTVSKKSFRETGKMLLIK